MTYGPPLEWRHVPAERSNTGIAYDEIVYKTSSDECTSLPSRDTIDLTATEETP